MSGRAKRMPTQEVAQYFPEIRLEDARSRYVPKPQPWIAEEPSVWEDRLAELMHRIAAGEQFRSEEYFAGAIRIDGHWRGPSLSAMLLGKIEENELRRLCRRLHEELGVELELSDFLQLPDEDSTRTVFHLGPKRSAHEARRDLRDAEHLKYFAPTGQMRSRGIR